MSRMYIICSFRGVIDAESLSSVCSCCFLFFLPFPLWTLLGVALMFPRTLQNEEIFLHLHFIALCLLTSHLAWQGTIPCITWTLPNPPERAGHTSSDQQESPRAALGAAESITALAPGWEKPNQEKNMAG